MSNERDIALVQAGIDAAVDYFGRSIGCALDAAAIAATMPDGQTRSEWGNVAPDSDGKYQVKQPVNVIKQAAEKHGVPYPALVDALREVNSIMHPHGPWHTTDAVSPFGRVHTQPEAAQPAGEAVAHPCWSCKKPVTLDQRAGADGNCPHCGCELDLEDWPQARATQPAGEAVALESLPTDEMVIRGAEELHDAIRAEGIDIDFDKDLKGTEIQQRIAESVFLAMLDSAPTVTAPPAQVPDGWKITYLAPSKEMIEEGAQRLVSWSDNCKWPDSWSAMQVAAARNDAEHVWRSMWLAAPQQKGGE
ncbi:hypothetical protein [Aquitalea sp. USM4]|uniref:hypothetical protein n=1 Tax=Aquitalea sp. USM4 TaxID=1590041 RepID=UPI00103C108A|nr:hypothetical protein [Aquitalea sp. USM4]QBJ80487.1 hypothetical protein DKK66_19760 [Aquitalea sp. USM4]